MRQDNHSGILDEINAKLKRVIYDMETVRRKAENTTDIDRMRDEMDNLILRMRNLEIVNEKKAQWSK